jgi:hypothetical protein
MQLALSKVVIYPPESTRNKKKSNPNPAGKRMVGVHRSLRIPLSSETAAALVKQQEAKDERQWEREFFERLDRLKKSRKKELSRVSKIEGEKRKRDSKELPIELQPPRKRFNDGNTGKGSGKEPANDQKWKGSSSIDLTGEGEEKEGDGDIENEEEEVADDEEDTS